ncbi:MAG: PmoA family protein [Pirellulaceae bacterium]
MHRKCFALSVSVALLLAFTAASQAAQFEVEKTKEGLAVKLDGKLLTNYLIKSGAKPIFWPVIGAGGAEVTRGYPMRDATPDERDDHIHHRSFWFTHGNVNGVDFWAETAGHGNIIQREMVKAEGGKTAVIVTRNDWLGPDGKKHCEDLRTFTFHSDGDRWWVDCDIVVTASEGPVTFGDTKEGSFGVRVAGTMKIDAKVGDGGTVVNSEGQTDGAAWGQAAKWVDYHGPAGKGVEGVAILNHPSSFRFPTTWHVRTYGLFCANPFGLHDFQKSKEVDGSHTIPKGETMTLRHRVLFHKGDEKQGKVAESWADYAKQK